MVLAEFSVGQFLEQAGLAGAGGRPEVADDARHVDVVTAQSVVARRRIRQLGLLATLACTHTHSQHRHVSDDKQQYCHNSHHRRQRDITVEFSLRRAV